MSSLIVRGDTRHLPLRDASVDAIVTDPPYMIGIAPWDHPPKDPTTRTLSRPEQIICWDMDWGHEAWRVLRPGGYLFVFSSKRTIQWIAVGLRERSAVSVFTTWLSDTGRAASVSARSIARVPVWRRNAPDGGCSAG